MTRGGRLIGFGAAALLVLAGALLAALVGGSVGEIVALVLIGLGFIAATSLVFLEVGLSEDHERAQEESRRAEPHAPRRREQGGRSRLQRRARPRLQRMRGQRRRLR